MHRRRGRRHPDANEYKPCGTKSCPIDVAAGRMYTLPEEDLSLPGPLPLVCRYSSFVRARDTGLGYGWVQASSGKSKSATRGAWW